MVRGERTRRRNGARQPCSRSRKEARWVPARRTIETRRRLSRERIDVRWFHTRGTLEARGLARERIDVRRPDGRSDIGRSDGRSAGRSRASALRGLGHQVHCQQRDDDDCFHGYAIFLLSAHREPLWDGLSARSSKSRTRDDTYLEADKLLLMRISSPTLEDTSRAVVSGAPKMRMHFIQLLHDPKCGTHECLWGVSPTGTSLGPADHGLATGHQGPPNGCGRPPWR